MNKRFSFLLLWIFLASSCSAVLADDAGFAITPQQYAEQESEASVHDYGNVLCNSPGYSCLGVRKQDNWYALFPHFQQREEIMRLNRTNVALMYRNWIIEPKNLSQASYMQLSPLPQNMDTGGKKLLFVNLHLFAFGAYDAQGHLLYWGPVSSGAEKCPGTNGTCSTVTGHFKVYRMGGKDCASKEYPLETHGGAPMPYCMFFHAGTAIHASTLSGFINRSSGCVRLFYSDAQWLYERFVKLGTNVVVVK